MKLNLLSVLFMLKIEVGVLSRSSMNIMFQKALSQVVNSVAKHNHLLTIVESEIVNDASKSAVYDSVVGIPHIVQKIVAKNKPLSKPSDILLNSSALVIVESMK